MKSTPQIEALFANYPDGVRETAVAARKLLARALPGAKESLDESAKLLGYAYGPGYKGLLCTLIMSRSGVKLGLLRGAELADPKRLMAGTGKVHRHVQLRSAADVDNPAVAELLERAVLAWRQRNAPDG